MTRTVILPEASLAFEYVAAFDAYAHTINSLPFVFETGYQYTIVWDGIEYVRTAFAFTAADGSSCVAVGNPLAAGESSNGDPFAIVCNNTNSYLYYISTEIADTHTVVISLNEGIVLKDRNGNNVAYYGIETVTFDTTTEGKQQTFTKGIKEDKTVALDMAAGDLVVEPDADKLFGKVTVTKPETLTPENIRNGVEIGGILGTLIGDTEEQTLALAMADGDMVIEPSEAGKVLSKVTIQKPETLVPENIAEGVNIGGLAGIFKGGAVAENDINFFDYDGTLLHSYTIEDANNLTELPKLPEQPGLICQGWNTSLENVQAADQPMDFGAIYTTDDGKTRVHIVNTSEKDWNMYFYINQSVAYGVTVDWGDGSDPVQYSTTGNIDISHTYTDPGEYVVTFAVASGCTLTLGQGSSKYFNGTATSLYGSVRKIHIGSGSIVINSDAFRNCYSLHTITIPEGITEIPTRAFYSNCPISFIAVPRSVTSIGGYAFSSIYALRIASLSDGVKTLGTNVFRSCNGLVRCTLQPGVTSIPQDCFSSSKALRYVAIPSTVETIDSAAFSTCNAIERVKLPEALTTISSWAFQSLFAAEITPFPKSLTSIGDRAFSTAYGINVFDFSQLESIPTLAAATAFSASSYLEIKVPSALLDDWKAATNWSTLADYIVGV